jgi:GntR family transcriptional regulator
MQGERQKFLAEEWPRVHATIQRLGLSAEELLAQSSPVKSSSKDGEEER